MAGGVALNCVSNTKIYNSKIFENIWVQPASDAGTALGAALLFYYHNTNQEKNYLDLMFILVVTIAYEIESALKDAKIENLHH